MNTSHNKYNHIQQLYKLIKKDDLISLSQILNETPEYLKYTNKYGNSLLSYALEKQSPKVSRFLLEHNLKEINKTKNNQDILSILINKNNYNALEFLFSSLSTSELKELYSIKRNEPIIFSSVRNLTKKTWDLFYQHCYKFVSSKDLTYVSENGFNIAHLIANYNQSYSLPILQNAPKEIYYQIDSDSGSTPLLIAAKYSDNEIINFFSDKSDINHKTFLGSNIAHVSSMNTDPNVFELIIKENINLVEKNIYGYTPLMASIFEKSSKNANLLFPFYATTDISDELLEASKNFNSIESFFDKNLLHITFDNFKVLQNNPEKITTLFSNLFYYCNEKILNELITSPLWSLIEQIKDNYFYMHQLYTSSITNRKYMAKKISILLQTSDFLHADNTEEYYMPVIESDVLSFKSIYKVENEEDYPKTQKGFCFISTLSTLPIGQMKDILEKTNLITKLNRYDLLLLFSVGLKKQSNYILDKVIKQFKDFISIDESSNYDYAIQFNLSKYALNYEYDKFYKEIIKSFNHIPYNLLHNISHTLVTENRSISQFEDTLVLFKEYPFYKKEIISSVIKNLLQVNHPPEQFLHLFYQKPTLLFYVFKSLIIKEPELIKNNDLFKYIIEHEEFNNTSKNWKFIFSLSNSANDHKYDLIKKILPVAKINSQNDILVFQEYAKDYQIDDHTWRLILNYTYKNKYFQAILNQYLLYVSLQDENCNTITLKKSIDKIDDTFTNTKTWLSNIVKQGYHSDDTILLFEEVFLRKNNISELINIGLEHSNFSYLEHLISHYNVSIEALDVCSFWTSEAMSQIFELNIIKNKYEPLNDYLLFINQHKNDISDHNFNNIIADFFNWYSNSLVDYKTKLEVSTSLFSILQDKISVVDDVLLANVCSLILNNDKITLTNTTKINNVVNLIFSHKEDSFFHRLQNNKDFIEHQSSLSESNKIIMNYYSLKSELNKSKVDLVKNKPKKNKI